MIARSSRRPHLKGRALGDLEEDRRKPKVAHAGPPNDLAHRRGIIVLDSTAEREGEKLLGQCSDEDFRTLEQRVFETGDDPEEGWSFWYEVGGGTDCDDDDADINPGTDADADGTNSCWDCFFSALMVWVSG